MDWFKEQKDKFKEKKEKFKEKRDTLKERISDTLGLTSSEFEDNNNGDSYYNSNDDNNNIKKTIKCPAIIDLCRFVKHAHLINEEPKVSLLIEIASAYGIPMTGSSSNNNKKLYVSVDFGPKEIYRTETIKISKTVNAIWTIGSGSLFLITNIPEDTFRKKRLDFTVYDESKKRMVGLVVLDGESLLAGTGQREVYEISTRVYPKSERSSRRDNDDDDDSDDDDIEEPTLVLRYKPATDDDLDFLTKVYGSKKGKDTLGLYEEYSFLRYSSHDSTFMKRSTQTDKATGRLQYRVKPYADPDNKEGTKWLTEHQIYDQSNEPSKHWIEAGSLGVASSSNAEAAPVGARIYFELLRCDNLPNKDASSKVAQTLSGDKTDAFACIVFQDAIVQSDVISDSNSPRWMPWCQRAFVFNVSYPATAGSSLLYIGLFDYDMSTAHDPIGRILVNTMQFRSNTLYTLTYNLYDDEEGHHREICGTITFRLRIDWNHTQRTCLIQSIIQPPPNQYVSVMKDRYFKVGHYTVQGKSGDHSFSLETITWYLQELNTYVGITEFAFVAYETIIFWRGHYPINCFGRTFALPIHSIVAFVWGIFLAEDFDLIPAFVAFSIAWTLLATMEYIRKHPSPWHRCRSYQDLLGILLFNSWSSSSPITIPQNDNLAAIKIYNEELAEKKERLKKVMEEQQKIEAEIRKQQQEAEAALAADDQKVESEYDKFLQKINVLKPILFPIQKVLGGVIVALRIVKSIVLWDECYYAFWIVTACILASFLLIWIPWGFLFHWVMRIAVWVFLGPWMKLVDWFYYSKIIDQTMTPEEKLKVQKKRVMDRFKALAKLKRILLEDIEKLKNMRHVLFGKYTIGVPSFMQECFPDYPLPASYANPYEDAANPIIPKRKVMGQRLVGHMIPQRDSHEVSSLFFTEKQRALNGNIDDNEANEKEPLLSPAVGNEDYEAL